MDNEETNHEGLSSTPVKRLRGIDWTAILARENLETPGYHETMALANMKTQKRAQQKIEEKSKKKAGAKKK